VNDEEKTTASFTVVNGSLTSTEGSLTILSPMQKGHTFWKMSAKWQASMDSVGQRDTTMMIAGDIAKGAIIYAGDNNETLPATEAEFVKSLEPYVTDKRMFAGFKYTFKGGKLPPESERGSVELGVVHGPTGKAIVFLNGERKWVPSK